MRTLLALFVTLLVFTWPSQAFAMQPRHYTDDEKEFFKTIHDSCKQSVTAKLSEKEFQKTICYAHLQGAKEAAGEIGMSFGMMAIGYSENCKEMSESLKMATDSVCVPENLTTYQFAKDYVAYVDRKEYMPYESPQIMRAGEHAAPRTKFYEPPSQLFTSIYRCKKNPVDKKPDAK